MSTTEVLTKAIGSSPPAQFLKLYLARERGDKPEAQAARRQLEKLGVKVRFTRR
jgi:hypothetical protein